MWCNSYHETEQNNWTNPTNNTILIFHFIFIPVVIYRLGYSSNKNYFDCHCWDPSDSVSLDGLHNVFSPSR